MKSQVRSTPLRNVRRFACGLFLATALAGPAGQTTRTLDIYWIDVEGGASTLIVTPQGQSVLMDTGWAGFNDRDASRIEHVIRKKPDLFASTTY